MAELEYLLNHFPELRYETWTLKNMSPLIVADSPMELDARLSLGHLYRQLGSQKKLEDFVTDSVAAMPEFSQLFLNLLL
ncbi:MAG: hypothetical protein AAF623_20370 [Planctomycetota bacterium]